MTRASVSSLLQKRTQAGIQQCEPLSLKLGHIAFNSCTALTPRLNTFLELKMENLRLQHRVHELRAQKAPFLQTPSTSMAPPLTTSALPSNFGGNPSSTTSSLPVQLPIDPPSSTIPDHTELTATNPSPVTRNFDAAGLQEGDQDEPAKKKVRRFDIQTQLT